MPSVTSSVKSSASSSRTLSTSSAARASAKKTTADKTPTAPSDSTPASTGDGPVVSSAGVPVSSPAAAPRPDAPTPAEEAVAPGVPDAKDEMRNRDGDAAAEALSVRMPQYVETAAEEDAVVIVSLESARAASPRARETQVKLIEASPWQPFAPDNFTSSVGSETEPVKSQQPKVMTVASASTHLDDGPRHSLHETVDGETSPSEQSSGGEAESDAQQGGESLSSSLFSGSAMAAGASIGLGDAIRFPSLAGGKPYQAPKNRPMTAEERRGAWVLAGLLGGGFLLGGLGSKE